MMMSVVMAVLATIIVGFLWLRLVTGRIFIGDRFGVVARFRVVGGDTVDCWTGQTGRHGDTHQPSGGR